MACVVFIVASGRLQSRDRDCEAEITEDAAE
jgi:hypothetical protein